MTHMNTKTFTVALATSLLVCFAASAVPFAPQFTVVKTVGICQAQTPGSPDFVDVEEGQAFAYGTLIKTGEGVSCILAFSEGNGALICQNSTVRIDEQDRRKSAKVLRIAEGEIEFNLEKGFRRHNQLSVETPSGICEAIACTCAVDFKIIGDLKTSNFRCTEGDVEIRGDFFAITDVGDNEQVTVAQTPNNNFLRIKVVSGDITLIARNPDGAELKIPLATGDELTIIASDSEIDPSKLDVVYKIVYADKQKAELPPWQASFPKAVTAPPDGAGPGETGLPLPKERKWSSLTVAPPIPTVTPVGMP